MITYWGFTQIANHTGLDSGALRGRRFRGTMPEPDAIVGTAPGWLPATIEEWWAASKKVEEPVT